MTLPLIIDIKQISENWRNFLKMYSTSFVGEID